MPIQVNYQYICDGCDKWADTDDNYYLEDEKGWEISEQYQLGDEEYVLCPGCLKIVEERENKDESFKNIRSRQKQIEMLREEKAFPDNYLESSDD